LAIVCCCCFFCRHRCLHHCFQRYPVHLLRYRVYLLFSLMRSLGLAKCQ
jgi:hypothetical protein